MAEVTDEPTRHAAAYAQLEERFLHLNWALQDQVRAFGDAAGQILAILQGQADAFAKLAKSAELTGTPIEELGLGSREYGLLTRAGIHTVEQLMEMTEADLNDLRNSGVKSVANIKRALEARGLALKEASDV